MTFYLAWVRNCRETYLVGPFAAAAEARAAAEKEFRMSQLCGNFPWLADVDEYIDLKKTRTWQYHQEPPVMFQGETRPWVWQEYDARNL